MCAHPNEFRRQARELQWCMHTLLKQTLAANFLVEVDVASCVPLEIVLFVLFVVYLSFKFKTWT